MKTKIKQKKKLVLFHQVPIGGSVLFDKELMVKYAPKCALSSSGKKYQISDSTAVEVVAV